MENHRLERVEERIAWLERHVVEQDKVVLELSEQLQRMKRDIALLRDAPGARDAPDAAVDAPADERPPHY